MVWQANAFQSMNSKLSAEPVLQPSNTEDADALQETQVTARHVVLLPVIQ